MNHSGWSRRLVCTRILIGTTVVRIAIVLLKMDDLNKLEIENQNIPTHILVQKQLQDLIALQKARCSRLEQDVTWLIYYFLQRNNSPPVHVQTWNFLISTRYLFDMHLQRGSFVDIFQSLLFTHFYSAVQV